MYPYIDFWGLHIPSYGLCMTIGIILCGFFSINKACKSGLTFEDVIIIAAVSVGAGLLSGGLLYIIVTYSLEEICNYIQNGEISFITNSGLVFYGGLIGGIIGALISCKILDVKIESLETCVMPCIPLGHAIGRIGCLLAGCCRGFEYYGIFAVENGLIPGRMYFPIQAVEALLNLLIMLFLLLYTKKERPKYYVLYCYLMMYSIMRFCLEFFRGDEIRGAFMNFTTSQWLSIVIFSFCVVGKYLFYKNNKSIKDNL